MNRRTLISDFGDLNETGGRAGITTISGPRTIFSAGLVCDARLNCDRTVYSSCSELFPEISFSLLFQQRNRDAQTIDQGGPGR